MIVTDEHKATLDSVAQDRAAGLKPKDPPITLESLHARIVKLENQVFPKQEQSNG